MVMFNVDGENIRLSPTQIKIVRFIGENNTFKPVDLHLNLGLSYQIIHKNLDYLKSKGLIQEKW